MVHQSFENADRLYVYIQDGPKENETVSITHMKTISRINVKKRPSILLEMGTSSGSNVTPLTLTP